MFSCASGVDEPALVAGGFPATSGLQRAIRGPVGLALLTLSALAAAVLLALQVRGTTIALRSVPTPSRLGPGWPNCSRAP